MKFVYKIFLDSYGEMEEIMASEGKSYQVECAKDLMKELSRHYMIEAKWKNEGYEPTSEEHESVFICICRLQNAYSNKEGKEKEVVSTVECYMKEHDVKEEYVYNLFKERVEDAWNI
ncbi:putative (-)-beta-caryophyllene synthase [Helianthus annuus]|nr:putative (-)-beta-caryophyllene synthase [Helianthus annuus]